MALNGIRDSSITGSSSVNGAPAVTTKRPAPKTKITSGHNLNTLLYLMYARHNFVFCKAIIEQCIVTGCDLEYPYYVKGLIARHDGNPAEAIKHFQKAVELNSTNPEYYREIAKTLYQIGRYKQSLEIFIRTETHLKRTDCESQYYIAKLLTKNVSHGQLKRQDAKEYFMKAIQGGRHLHSMHELAEIYVREGDLRKSIELLENSLQINCDDVDILTRMGILHLMIGETQTAFTRLLDALVIDGNSPKLILALGGILQARGDADGALNKYKSIANWEEQGAELWSNMGLCFMRSGKIIAAISCLRKSIVIAPLNFNVLFNLGYVLMKAKLYVGALNTLATALNLKPKHTEGIMLLGICLSELKDTRNAMAAFEKAANMSDVEKYPLACLNHAIFSYQCHEYGPSWKSLNRYLAIMESKKGGTDQQTGGSMRNHLKVARKLMCLLKLISNEPETEHDYQGQDKGSLNGARGGAGAANPVIASSAGETGDEDVTAGYKDEVEDACGPSLVGGDGGAAARGSVDGDEDLDEDSLETGGGGHDTEDDDKAAEGYEFVTVFADVERKIE